MNEKESSYFSVGEAWNKLKKSNGAKEKAISSIKLLGKSVYNVGRFTVAEVVPGVAEAMVRQVERNENSNPEQRIKAEELKEKASEIRSRFKD